jgi:hypothetical protein
MSDDAGRPVTREDIDKIQSRLYATEQAIAFILLSLSKQTDLDPIFDDADATALTLGEKRAPGVGEVIHDIRYAVKEARTAKAATKITQGFVAL